MFPNLKAFLGGRRFKSYEELKDAVREKLHGLAAEIYDEGVKNWSQAMTSTGMLVASMWKYNLRSITVMN
jgi:shikimate kinase